jgi:hypothetical protein
MFESTRQIYPGETIVVERAPCPVRVAIKLDSTNQHRRTGPIGRSNANPGNKRRPIVVGIFNRRNTVRHVACVFCRLAETRRFGRVEGEFSTHPSPLLQKGTQMKCWEAETPSTVRGGVGGGVQSSPLTRAQPASVLSFQRTATSDAETAGAR